MKSSNNINDLRTALFTQLERLQDSANDLDKEINRAKAMTEVGNSIISSAKAEIDFYRATNQVAPVSGFLNANDQKELPDAK